MFDDNEMGMIIQFIFGNFDYKGERRDAILGLVYGRSGSRVVRRICDFIGVFANGRIIGDDQLEGCLRILCDRVRGTSRSISE